MPLYALAALLEITGCFAVWSWWRGASALWLIPGALALAGFAYALALTPPPLAKGAATCHARAVDSSPTSVQESVLAS